MTDERLGPGTYMTPDEAKEFHKLFTLSMGFFVGVACLAHYMVWIWRPWFGASLPLRSADIHSVTHVAQAAISTLFG